MSSPSHSESIAALRSSIKELFDEIEADDSRTDNGVVLEQLRTNSHHLKKAYSYYAQAEYLAALTADEESKIKAEVMLELLRNKAALTFKVEHLNSLVLSDPAVQEAQDHRRRAKRLHLEAKGPVEAIMRRAFALNSIAAALMKLE